MIFDELDVVAGDWDLLLPVCSHRYIRADHTRSFEPFEPGRIYHVPIVCVDCNADVTGLVPINVEYLHPSGAAVLHSSTRGKESKAGAEAAAASSEAVPHDPLTCKEVPCAACAGYWRQNYIPINRKRGADRG